MNIALDIARMRFREFVSYDLGPLGEPSAWATRGAAAAMIAFGGEGMKARAAQALMRVHTAALSESADRSISAWIRDSIESERTGGARALKAAYDRVTRQAVSDFRRGPRPDTKRLIGSRLLVVKSHRPGERGVLVADYQYVFPLLWGLFDLPGIAERYTIVLEPSWAGCCAPEILMFSRLPKSVYVQTTEPRDHTLFQTINSNLVPVPIAANWWIRPRQLSRGTQERDIDVIMVAAWADIKRHWRVFRALSDLRRRGHKLQVALVGYRHDRTKDDIEAQARHFGILDQVALFENITEEEVASLLLRSKVHVLWSRRECANRAIIEAMLADVPVIVREGLTFGYPYPYINPSTGRFVTETELGNTILEMIENRKQFAPRDWVLQNMTCERASGTLESTLRNAAVRNGEPWTAGLTLKTSTLHSQYYLNPADRDSFTADYRFFEDSVR